MSDRYEFRCWGEDLSAQKTILEDSWTVRGEEHLKDTYLLGGVDRFAIKLSAGQFQAKEMLNSDGWLELWRPVADIAFPLSMDELAPWLEQAFGVTGAVTSGDAELDEVALVDFVTRHEVALALPVEKHRRKYELAGVLAEHVTVDVARRQLDCVAVEGEEPTRLHTGLRLLKIEDRENQAYPVRLLELAKRP